MLPLRLHLTAFTLVRKEKRSIKELFQESSDNPMPNPLLRNFIFWLSTKKTLTDWIAARGMRRGFARRFVAGDTLSEAIPILAELSRAGRRIILNHLGENVGTRQDAENARDGYVQALNQLNRSGFEATALAGAAIGPAAASSVSVKLTQLGLAFDPDLSLSLTQEIAAEAQRLGRGFEIDMEESAYTAATLSIFEAVQTRHGNAGIAIQAYLRRSEADLDRLAGFAPKVRLVKGAYREPPSIAFQDKKEVDANYRKLLDRLLRQNGAGRFTAAIATHDPALIEFARGKLAEYQIPPGRYEFQMLLGIRRDLQQQIFAQGHPLRIYVPFGTAWVPYFMRRLSERPANVWFVVRSLTAEGKRG